jgi:trehalose 6-phosphate phosphatase
MAPDGLSRCEEPGIAHRIANAYRLWLFLDYDGTLADFAPTPEHAMEAPEVVHVLTALTAAPRTRVAVVSGRPLDHLHTLVPTAGVWLAGTYGIELSLPDGRRVDRVPLQAVRPRLEELKPEWASSIAGREGFFLEDKGWALALHARFADDSEAEEVLSLAARLAADVLEEQGPAKLHLLGGHKFLEIAPISADKGETLNYLLSEFPWEGALSVYVGDDDKDEKAFIAAKAHGGLAAVVVGQPRATHADCRIESPHAVRDWLARIAEQRSGSS